MAGDVLSPDDILAGTGIGADPLDRVMGGGSVVAPAAPAPQPLSGRVVRVVNPDGKAGDIPEENLEQALSLGYSRETGIQRAAREFVAENKGIKGAVKVGLMQFADEALMGIPELVGEHMADPVDRAKYEALKKDHELANAIGGVAGFGASMAYGAPLFKGAAAVGGMAERGVLALTEKALAGKIAATGVEAGSREIAGKIVAKALASGASLGTEAGLIAAPHAITEAALGDPDAAAETLLWSIGPGAVLGFVAPSAKAIVRGALEGVPGLRISRAAKVGAEELSQKATATATDTITAEVVDQAAGPVSGAVDTAGEWWVNRQKVGDEAKGALRRVLKDDAGALGRQEEMLDEAARAWKKVGDVAMKVDDVVLPKIAFGEGKAAQMAQLVDTTRWETASSVLNETRNLVDGKIAELESFVDKGGSDGVVKRLRKSLDAYEQKVMWSTGTQPSEEAVRDSFMYLDKLKRDVGKQAGMGLKPHQRNVAQTEAFNLYHQLIEPLENEAAWGPAAAAQKAVNAATAKKLGTSEAFKSAFITDFEKKAGNAVSEFDPGDIKGYLRNVLGAENDLKERALTEWVAGLESQMGAVEQHYALTAAEKAEFATARDALKQFKAGIGEAKENARGIALIKRMQEEERGKAVGGLAGIAVDFFTRPVTVAERLAAARKLVLRVEKLGVLTTEQSMKRAGAELDKVPSILDRLASVSAARGAAIEAAPMSALARFAGDHDGKKSREDQYEALSTKITEARANLERTADRMASLSSGFADGGAPNIAAAYTRKQQQALEYLFATMPKPTELPGLFASKKKRPPPEREILAWERRVEAALDPFSVLAHLERGTLAREHLETMQELSPALLAQIRERIVQYAADPKAPELTGPARARVEMLLDMVGTTPSTSSMRRLQDNFAGQEEAQKLGGGGAGPMKAPDLQTNAQRIMSR